MLLLSLYLKRHPETDTLFPGRAAYQENPTDYQVTKGVASAVNILGIEASCCVATNLTSILLVTFFCAHVYPIYAVASQ